jgi:hypothetical protein
LLLGQAISWSIDAPQTRTLAIVLEGFAATSSPTLRGNLIAFRTKLVHPRISANTRNQAARDVQGVFACCARVVPSTVTGMISRSAVFALLACLSIIGCVTKGDQITPAQTAREEKYQQLWVRDQDGRIQ